MDKFDELFRVKTIMEERLRQEAIQKSKIDEVRRQYEEVKTQADTEKDTINYIVELLKQIRAHEDDRKQAAYALINESLKEVSKVIPASNMANATLMVEEGKAYIVDKEHMAPIKSTEGGASNTVADLIMRYLLISNNPSLLQMMYIDEGLFAVGHSNIEALKSEISEMAKDTLIIITEQKHDVTEGIADTTYRFMKESYDAPTVIVKEDNVNAVENNQE